MCIGCHSMKKIIDFICNHANYQQYEYDTCNQYYKRRKNKRQKIDPVSRKKARILEIIPKEIIQSNDPSSSNPLSNNLSSNGNGNSSNPSSSSSIPSSSSSNPSGSSNSSNTTHIFQINNNSDDLELFLERDRSFEQINNS
ncbi:13583_t:CDS:1 [Ambispora leptoticha]|uniref:13583_t:CDS:1 n=1 Tax=Ambispora leptoticha TaxID=144679 RepID=A0A9N9D2V1_9GLOM|nr:13583_t:CDS:1 [Ambispora leptoticha]